MTISKTNAAAQLETPHAGRTLKVVKPLTPGVRARLAKSGLLGLGEAYMNGELDLAPLEECFSDILREQDRLPGKFSLVVIAQLLKELLINPQQGLGIFEVAHRHYDLGNDLYAAMLDSSMSYTCGYWRNASNLEEAQIAKLERLCQKLHLSKGMHVLDVGCGWGNFAKYAAERYGVTVVGLTISKEQQHLAQERCKQLPVEILLQDYRTFHGAFDRIVSIEMIEAVGRKNLKEYFEMISRCLKPEGRFALQAISGDTFSTTSSPALDQYITWLLRHIFPNGYLPQVNDLIPKGSSTLVLEEIEGMAADYEKTLAAWHHNFESAWPLLSRQYDERFKRMWRFYLCGCRAFFRQRMVQVYQVVYSKVPQS